MNVLIFVFPYECSHASLNECSYMYLKYYLFETKIFPHFLTVPGKSQPVGIYVPKNGPKGYPKITSRPKPRPKRKTPQPRPQPKQKPKSKRPMFQINIAPNSPLRKLYEMSKSKSEKVIQNLKKVKLKDHRYIKSKHSKFLFHSPSI